MTTSCPCFSDSGRRFTIEAYSEMPSDRPSAMKRFVNDTQLPRFSRKASAAVNVPPICRSKPKSAGRRAPVGAARASRPRSQARQPLRGLGHFRGRGRGVGHAGRIDAPGRDRLRPARLRNPRPSVPEEAHPASGAPRSTRARRADVRMSDCLTSRYARRGPRVSARGSRAQEGGGAGEEAAAAGWRARRCEARKT